MRIFKIMESSLQNSKRRVAVVVPVYNAALWTRACIEALIAQGAGDTFDLFVQDDHSPDPLVRIVLEELHAKKIPATIEFSDVNRGFLGTCNALFEQLREKFEFVFLCNSDVLVTPGCFVEAVRLFDAHPKAALVSFLTTQGAQHTICLPDGVDPLDFSVYLRKFNYRKKVNAVTSTGHLIGIRSAAIPLGAPLFDPIYGKGYGEETDLHYRLLSGGFEALVVPNSFVYHRGESSFGVLAHKGHLKSFYERWGATHKAAMEAEEKFDTLAWLRMWGATQTVSSHFLAAQTAARDALLEKIKHGEAGKPLAFVFLSNSALLERFDDVCFALLDLLNHHTDVFAFVENEDVFSRRLPVKTFCWENAQERNFFEYWGRLSKHCPVNYFCDFIHDKEYYSPAAAMLNISSDKMQPLFAASLVSHPKNSQLIVIAAPDYTVSGGIFVIKEFAHALRSAGFEVLIATPSGPKHPDNIQYESKPVSLEYLSMEIKAPIELLVFTWWESLFWASMIPTKRFLWLAQSIEEFFVPEEQAEERIKILAPYLLRGIEVIAVSPWIQAQLSVRFGIESQLILNQIPGDFDWKALHCLRDWKKIKSPSDASVVIEGSFSPFKNLGEAIALVNSLNFRKKTLIYAGNVDDQTNLSKLPSQGWRVLNNIARTKVLEEFKNSDLLIRTSLLDSFGFAPLEMMATEGLVMVKHYQGAPGLCHNGVNSICFQTVEDIHAAFRMQVETNGEYFSALAKEGYEFSQAFIGTANARYVTYVKEILTKPADLGKAAAIQLLGRWRTIGQSEGEWAEKEIAMKYGFIQSLPDDMPGKRKIISFKPLRYRIADAIVLGIFKRLFPKSFYQFLKSLFGRKK
jgi:GT2 family glycosyltransferase